ncbi:MAG: redoxin domain-containing protein [Cyclobacteriaceae bacterium]|nr:redoxin domain-containing protein [Cyclobacteriaceae bacterium]
MMKKIFLIAVLMSWSWVVNGQIALNFELTDVMTNSNYSLKDFKSKGVVIVFMGNKCPFSSYYIDRIKAIQNTYADQGIEVVLVNSFWGVDETIEKMIEFGNKYSLSNYIADKNGKLKKILGARKTPEVFLLQNKEGILSQFYKGPIDNNAQVADDVKYHYLKDNIDNLLEGKSAAKSLTPVMGCMIK